jgi:hypothetical protein
MEVGDHIEHPLTLFTMPEACFEEWCLYHEKMKAPHSATQVL